MKFRRGTRIGALALSIVLIAGACGSSSDDEGGGSGGGGGEVDATQVEEARARAEEKLAEPTALNALEPLAEKPDEGKTIAWLQCSQSSCAVIGDGVAEAVKVLGWNIERIDFRNEDPESVITAMDQAISSGPDAIAISGVASERFEASLAKAKDAGIPVITSAVVDEVGGMDGNGIIGLVGGPTSYAEGAATVLDWVIADSEGAGKVLLVTADDFPIIEKETDAAEAHLEEACSGCSFTRLNQAVADIATNTPNNVVSALQQDPDIGYVYFGFGDLSRGVAPAIAAAGNEAKVVGLAPVNENFQRVIDGEEAAWASWATSLIGWGLVDGLARHFNGEDMGQVNDIPLTYRLFTSDSPPPNENPIFPTNYADLYAELWQAD